MRKAANGTLRVINKALPSGLTKIAIREDLHRTYAKYFLPCVTAINMDKNSLDRFEILTPPSMCRKKGTLSSGHANADESYLATSSLLALYDEMDAYAFISKDKTGRGGVSVELTFDLYEEIKPWTRLILELKTEKQGRYVGFSSIEVKDSDSGRVVARGNHTKFMHHGLFWDLMHGPIFGPMVYDFYHRFRYNKISTPLDDLLIGKSTSEDAETVARGYPLFQTKEELFHANFSSLRLEDSTYTFDSEDADSGDKVLSHKYSLSVLSQTKNYIGLMHGGGVAGAIEQACYLFRFHGADAEKRRSQLRLSRMHIKYMNGTKVSDASVFLQRCQLNSSDPLF